MIVVGEGGIGKTRLLNEAVADARRRKTAVMIGRASVALPAAFGVIAEALRSWLRGANRAWPPSVFDPGLGLVLPEWAGATSSGLNDNQLRLLAHEGLVERLRDIAADGGVVLVVDDLHAADAESLEAIRYVIGAALPGVAVVAATRADESRTVDRLLATLSQQGLVDVWTVDPLGADEVGELVTALVGAEAPDGLVDEVLARADGMPLFVEEIVEAHVRAGSLVTDANGLVWRGGTNVVPRSVAALVASRLDRLSDAERSVVVAAALVGTDDTALLASVAGQPAAVVRAALNAGVDAGLVESVGGRTDFRHAVVADAVRDRAPVDARRAMHARAAAALALDATDDVALERLAGHLQAVGEHDRAARALVDAAVVAQERHATMRAESLAARAGELALDASAVDAADDARADALAAQGRWGEALEVDRRTVARRGRTAARWRRMVRCALDGRHFDEARALVLDSDDDSAFARVATGRVALLDGDAAGALASAQRVLDAPDADALSRCGALDLRGRALEYTGRRAEAADAWAEQSAVAETAGLIDERIRALVSLAELELFAGDPPIRMREVVEVAREAGAIVEEVWGEFNLAIAMSQQGDPRASLDLARHAAARCRAHGLDLLPFVLMCEAAAKGFLGDPLFWDDLAEARRLGGDAGDVVLHAGSIAAEFCLLLGRYDEAFAHLDEVIAAIAAVPGGLPSSAVYWRAVALPAAGRWGDVPAALDVVRAEPNLLRWPSHATLLAVAEAVAVRDAAAVDAALTAAPPRMPFDVALIRVLAAEALGGPEAARWLREALDLYEAHNGLLAVDRVRGLLRQAGGAVPRRRNHDTVAPELAARGVSRREADVLALVQQGEANSAIAEKLFVSVRTVESHVSSLLRKLGVSSRAELRARMQL